MVLKLFCQLPMHLQILFSYNRTQGRKTFINQKCCRSSVKGKHSTEKNISNAWLNEKKNKGGDVLEGSRNDDRKIMQSIKAMNKLPQTEGRGTIFFTVEKLKIVGSNNQTKYETSLQLHMLIRENV